MRAPPSAAVRVFRELYPKSEPNDPESLSEYGEYFLAPELRVELDLFYGALGLLFASFAAKVFSTNCAPPPPPPLPPPPMPRAVL